MVPAVVARIRLRLAARTRFRRAVGPVRDRLARRTSISDFAGYRHACERAARDPAAFAVFKRDPDYTAVLEHVACEHGADYLQLALQGAPQLEGMLDAFRRNDLLGSPRTCDYGTHGTFSPTTLRYVKVLSDLLRLFGRLDGLDLVEIGGGYGGQCFVVSVAASPAAYTIVDLPEPLALQRVYLRNLDVDARFLTADDLPPDGGHDLVLSNYAFSECVGDVQQLYLERLLLPARRGYLTMNFMSPKHYRALTADELAAAIPGSRWLPGGAVDRAAGCRILVWGTDQ